MPQKIPSLDLKKHHEPIKDEIYEAIRRVVESNHFIMGPEVTAFESELAQYCQSKHALGVSSGSDALLIALMALEVGPGDEVITTPFTFFATVGAITRCGATPVFVDIDPTTFNIDPAKIEEKITTNTKAIIPVHLYGQTADMDPINEIAKQYDLFVIEDAAQAVGAEYKGHKAGSLSTIGCYSFFPAKNLGAFGDGGGVATGDDSLAERMRILREHGSKPKYFHRYVGGNFRLDAIHAAVLRVKLKYLDKSASSRQAAASRYDTLFQQHGLGDRVQTPPAVHSRHVFNQYVLRVAKRDALAKHLSEQQIGNAVYYPLPMHLQECFASLGYKMGDFPESEKASQETLAIPMFPELTEEQQTTVVAKIADFYSSETRKAAA